MDATTARSLLDPDCPFYRRIHEIPDDRRRLPRPGAVRLPSRPERCRWPYRATEGAVLCGGRKLVHAADAERPRERPGERKPDPPSDPTPTAHQPRPPQPAHRH